MTVMIGGDTANVFDQFLQVVRCDPGLTSVQVNPYRPNTLLNFALLYFSPRNVPTTSSSRVSDLITSQTETWVLGVVAMYVLPNGALLASGGGGATFYPEAAGDPISIYIDISNYAGIGYVVHDQTGTKEIGLPLPVILYHELAHAKHFITGPFPALDDPNFETKTEVPAIAEENKFRSQVGLPLRHPTDHWGGPGAPPAGDPPFPVCHEPLKSFWGCLVATAATGSPYASEVQGLRDARDRYANLSVWSGRTATPMLDAYRQLSPVVVREMHANPALRRATLMYGVLPAFHLARIVELFLRSDAQLSELSTSISTMVDQYLEQLLEGGGSPPALQKAAEGAAGGAMELESDAPARLEESGWHEWPADLFPYLAHSIRSVTSYLPGFQWAFVGVADFLSVAASSAAKEEVSLCGYLSRLGAWLASVPIPIDAVSEADLRTEFAILFDRVFTRPALRAAFAETLIGRSLSRDGSKICQALADLGYIRLCEQMLGTKPVR